MSRLLISRSALRKNLNEIRARTGNAELIADLSQDGQGVGLLRLARFLEEEGVQTFAVTDPLDVLMLRRGGFTAQRILLLRSVLQPDLLRELMNAGTVFTIGSDEAGIALNGLAGELHTVVEAYLRVDTGTGFCGFAPKETENMLAICRHMPAIAVTGIYTLLPSLRSRKALQARYEEFLQTAQALQSAGAETGSLLAMRDDTLFRIDAAGQSCVMAGPALIGSCETGLRVRLERPARLEGTVGEISWLDAGSNAGAGSGTRIRKPTRAATVDVGWYQGIGAAVPGSCNFLQSLLRRSEFRIRDKRVRILGRPAEGTLLLNVTNCTCNLGDPAMTVIDPRLVRGVPVEISE